MMINLRVEIILMRASHTSQQNLYFYMSEGSKDNLVPAFLRLWEQLTWKEGWIANLLVIAKRSDLKKSLLICHEYKDVDRFFNTTLAQEDTEKKS